MLTMKELRIEARLTTFELAVKSGVSISSINRIEKEKAVKKLIALKVLDALNGELGKQYKLDDIAVSLVD